MREPIIIINQSSYSCFNDLIEAIAERGNLVTFITRGNYTFSSKNIKQIKAPRYNRNSLLSRLLSWTNFTMFALGYLLFRKSGTRILMTSNPPFLLHAIHILLGWKRFRISIRILDIYPDVLRSNHLTSKFSSIITAWEDMNCFAYSKTDSIITIGDSMREIVSKYANDKLVHSIPDWFDIAIERVPERGENPMRKALGLDEKIVILYSGNIGESHDLNLLIKAVSRLGKDSKIHIVIIANESSGKKRLLKLCDEMRFSAVTFLPHQSNEDFPIALGMADLAYVSIKAGSEKFLIPVKTYNYMASGTALLAVARYPCDLTNIVTKHDCGYVVPPDDEVAMKKVMERLSENLESIREKGKNAQNAALKYYNREVGMRKLMDVLMDENLAKKE